MTTTQTTKYRKGQHVVGLGRNGRAWTPCPTGIVTRAWTRKDGEKFVRVQWFNCCVEDDMRPSELRPA